MFRKLQPYIIEATGALLLLAFVLLPADSLSGLVSGRDLNPEVTPDSSGVSLPAPWIEIAERMEARREYRGVLDLMDRVITRESGTGRAEARLWRARFAARRGLFERAGAVLDSLALESGPWPERLRLSVTESAFDMALLRGDMNAARTALDLWSQSRGENDPGLDSLEADLNARFGAALLQAGEEPAEAALHLDAALSLGLPRDAILPTRFRYGQALARADSTDLAIDVLRALLHELMYLEDESPLARRANLELADVLYRGGHYPESRACYEAALPHVTTAADSGWVVLQLGDVFAQLGSGHEAHRYYEEYLDRWPDGTWARWARAGNADIDTTAVNAGGDPVDVEVEP